MAEDREYALPVEVLDNIVPFSGETQPVRENLLEKAFTEGRAVQRVQTAYTTAIAVQKPRSISRITANVLEEAKLAGASFYYGWAAKRKDGGVEKIEGPTIDLAMCLARNYGNCALDVEVDESVSHYIFRGVFIDLESGFTCPRLFRQRKGQKIGMKDQDRAEDIVFQIGQSKAQRNAIIKAMPEWLIDQAISTAKTSEIAKVKAESPALARAKVLDFFRRYGIDGERIEGKIGRKADLWTAEDIADLRGTATAVKEGRITAEEAFPALDAPDPETPRKGGGDLAPAECPNKPGSTMTRKFCDDCKERPGCPVWK